MARPRDSSFKSWMQGIERRLALAERRGAGGTSGSGTGLPAPVVPTWTAGVAYPAGTLVTHLGLPYLALVDVPARDAFVLADWFSLNGTPGDTPGENDGYTIEVTNNGNGTFEFTGTGVVDDGSGVVILRGPDAVQDGVGTYTVT